MAMFGWLFAQKKDTPKKTSAKPTRPARSARSATPRHEEASDSVLHEAGLAFGAEGERRNLSPSEQAAQDAADRALNQRREQRKADRTNRREALFGIVRESMLRTGILSTSYKFKVLSIDQKGRHFLVLLDLAMDLAHSEPAERLLEIEKMITENAMTRMQVTVQAVYWRHFVPSNAATVRISTGDTQPGGLTTTIRVGAEPEHDNIADNSSADAIATALAELRAKNRAKAHERHEEAKSSPPPAPPQGAQTSFAATQVIHRDQLLGAAGAAASHAESEMFPATQMLASPADAASLEELEAFQRALRHTPAAVQAGARAQAHEDNNPPSIFVSGKALHAHKDGDEGDEFDEHGFSSDLSGTQYGELR